MSTFIRAVQRIPIRVRSGQLASTVLTPRDDPSQVPARSFGRQTVEELLSMRSVERRNHDAPSVTGVLTHVGGIARGDFFVVVVAMPRSPDDARTAKHHREALASLRDDATFFEVAHTSADGLAELEQTLIADISARVVEVDGAHGVGADGVGSGWGRCSGPPRELASRSSAGG